MPEEKQEPKKKKSCCACPDTRKARDACIAENGEQNCQQYIEAHNECLKKLGYI